MGAPTLQEQIAAARAYEQLFVPALFRQWAPILAEAAEVGAGSRVLDVACGTGVLARELAAVVGPSGSVAGLDLTPGMVEVAKQMAPGIEWRQGSAESLPFADQTFDAVVCQFGLMFFPDRDRALREMLRVLKPAGRLALAVWAAVDQTPAIAAEIAIVDRMAGRAAADALRAPFALGSKTELERLGRSAGISATVRTHVGTARFPTMRVLVEADLRGWLPVMGVVLAEETIQRILEAADQELQPYVVSGTGEAVFRIAAHVLSGKKP